MTTAYSSCIAIAYITLKKDRELNGERYNGDFVKQGASTLWTRVKSFLIDYYLRFQKYSHIELAFPDEVTGSGKCTSFSVSIDAGLECRERLFTNPAYKWIFLSVTAEEKKTLLDSCHQEEVFCSHQRQTKGIISYDAANMHCLAVWPSRTRNKWTCTSFTVTQLQKIGILKHYNPHALDIDDVIFLTKHHSRRMMSFSPDVKVSVKSGETGVTLF
jgi:hypothetical protein